MSEESLSSLCGLLFTNERLLQPAKSAWNAAARAAPPAPITTTFEPFISRPKAFLIAVSKPNPSVLYPFQPRGVFKSVLHAPTFAAYGSNSPTIDIAISLCGIVRFTPAKFLPYKASRASLRFSGATSKAKYSAPM